jgi:hypothetical protein
MGRNGHGYGIWRGAVAGPTRVVGMPSCRRRAAAGELYPSIGVQWIVRHMNSTTSAQALPFPRTSGGLFILRCCVVAPAVSILACIGVLVSGTLSPRSSYISTISLIIDTMSVIEIVSSAIFLRSLIKSYIARTPGNLLFAALGVVSLLPALAVAILIVEGSFRHARI